MSGPEEGDHSNLDTSDICSDTDKEDDNTPRGRNNNYIPTQEVSLDSEAGEEDFASPMRKINKGSARTQTQIDSVEHKQERKKKGKQAMRDRVQVLRTHRMTSMNPTVWHVFSI